MGPGTGTPLTAAALADAQLYVQPGGGADLEGTWRHLRASAGAVRDWVRDGGSYLGLCFGAYLAGRNPPGLRVVRCHRRATMNDGAGAVPSGQTPWCCPRRRRARRGNPVRGGTGEGAGSGGYAARPSC
ncbi:BPL-N domain-containing protein [Streptomyces aureocirculatus]|uniref:BPL-N domain-containing protein n=1 Tax=Streptomyces aureocirculatus TaxID=67275 RepID=UPI001CED90C4|nr:BPL-N domain-containing protein [Streptomyces aureocirculatus]